MTDLSKTALGRATGIVLSCVAVLAAVVGVYQAIHSPLFTVQVVEVTEAHPVAAPDSPDAAVPWSPVDPQTITDLAAVPVGQANLFDLDLKGVEKRILSNDWIREVHLQKRFPQTLSITAVFRKPKAVIELDTGSLAYVDEGGKVFGQLNLSGPKDLPLITGVEAEDQGRLQAVIQLLDEWQAQRVSKFARIESMTDDSNRGYRLLVSYPAGSSKSLFHSWVDLGDGPGNDKNERYSVALADLARVFGYLHAHSIAARQIWADAGKKIVVKTAHGS